MGINFPFENDAISQILLNNADPRGEYHVRGNSKALSKVCLKLSLVLIKKYHIQYSQILSFANC